MLLHNGRSIIPCVHAHEKGQLHDQVLTLLATSVLYAPVDEQNIDMQCCKLAWCPDLDQYGLISMLAAEPSQHSFVVHHKIGWQYYLGQSTCAKHRL